MKKLAAIVLLALFPCAWSLAADAPPKPKTLISIDIPLDNKPDTETFHVVIRYVVLDSGFACDVRDVYDWAHQNSRHLQLTPEDMRKAISIVHSLPDRTDHIPTDQSVVLTEYLPNGKKQRQYDRAKLPPKLRELFALLGGTRQEVEGRLQFHDPPPDAPGPQAPATQKGNTVKPRDVR